MRYGTASYWAFRQEAKRLNIGKEVSPVRNLDSYKPDQELCLRHRDVPYRFGLYRVQCSFKPGHGTGCHFHLTSEMQIKPKT